MQIEQTQLANDTVNPTLTTEQLTAALKAFDPKVRARLVRNAAEKPVRYVIQFEYFAVAGKQVEQCACGTDELRGTASIRLQLPIGTSKDDALKALDRFRERIEGDSNLGQPQPALPYWVADVVHATVPLVLILASAPFPDADDDCPF